MLKKNNIAHLFDNSWKFVILRLDKEKNVWRALQAHRIYSLSIPIT